MLNTKSFILPNKLKLETDKKGLIKEDMCVYTKEAVCIYIEDAFLLGRVGKEPTRVQRCIM